MTGTNAAANTNANTSNVYYIDLGKIFKELLKRIWIILFVTVVFAVLGLIISMVFITPKYSATFSAYINNHNSNEMLTTVSSSDMSARSTLASTAGSIATSNTVLDEAAALSGMDPEDVDVTTSVNTTSGILTVRAVMADRQKVVEYTENLAKVTGQQVERIIEGSSMQLIDNPEEPEHRYSPSYATNTILAALIGAVIIIIIISIIAIKDDTMRDVSELETAFGIPVVGVIPDLASSGKRGGYYSYAYGAYGSKRRAAEKPLQTENTAGAFTEEKRGKRDKVVQIDNE